MWYLYLLFLRWLGEVFPSGRRRGFRDLHLGTPGTVVQVVRWTKAPRWRRQHSWPDRHIPSWMRMGKQCRQSRPPAPGSSPTYANPTCRHSHAQTWQQMLAGTHSHCTAVSALSALWVALRSLFSPPMLSEPQLLTLTTPPTLNLT